MANYFSEVNFFVQCTKSFLSYLLRKKQVSTLEALGVICTLTGIYYAAYGKIIAWPLQIMASLFYIWIFFTVHLFAETLLQGIYVVLAVYGWWAWSSGVKKHTPFTVTLLSKSQWIRINLLGLLLTGIIAQFQIHFLPTDVPYLDSFIFVFGLLAQWMQAAKKIENWLYWIIVDISAAGIYWHKNLPLSAGLYLILAVIALKGWRQWHRHYYPVSKLGS
jgi:nicotinamide mononucleotide transporter